MLRTTLRFLGSLSSSYSKLGLRSIVGLASNGRALRALAAPALLTLAIVPASAGCLSVNFTEGSKVPEARIKDIVPGVTTRTDVLSWFGAPDTFSNNSLISNIAEEMDLTPREALALPFSDAMVFRFTAGRMKGTFLGVWNSVEMRVTADTLVVFFDEQDKVSSFGYRKGTDDLDPASAAARDAAKAESDPGAAAKNAEAAAHAQ
jgi:hypothetical protein